MIIHLRDYSRTQIYKDDDVEILLEGLQPHPNLKKLGIMLYSGARLPSWIMGNMVVSLPYIVGISLINCPNIRQLPLFYQLPCLKSLYLEDLPKVEYGGDGSSSSSSSSLTELRITKCSVLASMPLAPLLEKLGLFSISEKLLCQQLSTTSSPHSRLSTLTIRNIEDIEALPEDVLRNLTSLKALSIQSCLKLLRLALSRDIQHLEYLKICGCKELDLSEDGMNWQGLRRLRKLLIGKFPKLVSLPEGLQHVSTLQSIWIFNCPVLGTLPESMTNLTSLKDLSIRDCPLLKERCRNDTGED